MDKAALHPVPQESSKLYDSTIVARILAGEKELFELLMRRYNQSLYRAIRSYLKDDTETEDAMQDTYLKAFQKLRQYRGDAAFSTWLLKIGINEALQRIRKKQNLQDRTNGALVPADNIIALPDITHINPEKLIIQKETQQLLERAIDQLPEKYRTVYILKEVEGMDTIEVAKCLELTPNNVKIRLHRSKALLKDALYKISTNAEVFEFGNSRCDRMVELVMEQI